MERDSLGSLEDSTDDFDNVLRLRLAGRPSTQVRNRQRELGRGWAAALDAVQQASEVMTATEERAREIEARGAALAERALNELRTAEARIQALEESLHLMEGRATEAEARAQEAEEWLARLHEAIQQRLLSRRDPFQSRAVA